VELTALAGLGLLRFFMLHYPFFNCLLSLACAFALKSFIPV
jgi:hypothetical protein